MLGNTYYGPGATLGWGLHSGRLAGTAAAARAQEQKHAADLAASLSVQPARATPWKIRAFKWTAWALFVAVAAHVVGRASGKKSLLMVHYVAAPIAALVVLAVSIHVTLQPEHTRIMRSSARREHVLHRLVGYAMIGLLATQVMLGASARFGTVKSLNALHRIVGWLILGGVAVLYMTSRSTATLHDDKTSNTQHEVQAYAFIAATSLLIAGGWLYSLRTPPTKHPKTLHKPLLVL